MPSGRGGGRGLRACAAGLAVVSAFGASARVDAKTDVPKPCARRVMQVVAHTDDDLIFMNPDVQRDVDRGLCVRTVYLTAGDGGLGPRYWPRREAGVQAAYAVMAGAPNRWSASEVPGTHVRLRTLEANPNVTLAFLRLPDGARGGDGFARTGGASLRKLWEGGVGSVTSVDAARPVTYTRARLVATLATVVREFAPDTIRVQDAAAGPHDAHDGHEDHADHQAAARFATAARAAYTGRHDLVAYAGYATAHRPANVSGDDLRRKKAAFYAYARYDDRACDSDRACTGKYAAWLRRQYAVGPG